MGYIHPAVSEICDPQSLDPICAKFDKFLAHGQAHIGQMGKWPWQCTTRGLDNSTKLWMEKIRQAVTEIWVPQVWQPPARPPARPPGLWRQYPSSPEGWGVKNEMQWKEFVIVWTANSQEWASGLIRKGIKEIQTNTNFISGIPLKALNVWHLKAPTQNWTSGMPNMSKSHDLPLCTHFMRHDI